MESGPVSTRMSRCATGSLREQGLASSPGNAPNNYDCFCLPLVTKKLNKNDTHSVHVGNAHAMETKAEGLGVYAGGFWDRNPT